MHLGNSRVLEKIKKGETAICTKINLCDPRAVEIAAMSGMTDCVWLCREHVPTDWKDIENMNRAAKLYGVDVMCRVSKGCYSDIVTPLEADCTGVMVPHVMNLEEAKKIVYYTKFHPIGRRPLDGGNCDGKFCMVDEFDYIKEANERRFTAIQIEDPEPLDDLEEICALDGIDLIFFGPADFSQGIGKPCCYDDEKLIQTRKLVAKTARKYGKIAGTTGGTDNFKELEDMGYNFISIGADVVGLMLYYADLKKKLNK